MVDKLCNIWNVIFCAIIAIQVAVQPKMIHAAVEKVNEKIEVSDARIRLVPESVKNSAVYFTLHNKGNSDASLVQAQLIDTETQSPLAEKTLLHETTTVDMKKSMKHVKHIIIKKKEKQELKPNSYHVMLINLNKKIKKEDSYQLKLVFADQSVLYTTAKVQALHGTCH